MVQLIVPDILATTRDLSIGAVSFGLVLGLFLWVFGWWSHRFWIVLITTVLAGVFGLFESSALQTQPLLAGVLMALAAGLLSLALVRVLAFLAGGLAGLWAVQAMVPNLTQSLICFLLFGILGLLLFRVWMMGITSLAGTLLSVYCGLSLIDRAGNLDVVAWTDRSTVLLNWICAFLVLLGVAMQYLLDRRQRKKPGDKKKESEPKDGWDVLASRTWNKYRKAS